MRCNRKSVLMISILVLFILFAMSCEKNSITPSEPKERMVVDNDIEQLNLRVTYYNDEEIELEPITVENLAKVNVSKAFKLILRAEITPPELNGELLHANHVTLDDQYAYISYHTRYDEFSGGVEIIDISNIQSPQILSQILYKDTDVTIATRNGDKVYLGGAVDSDHNKNFDSPAVLEIIQLNNEGLFTNQSQRFDLVSYNANDILCLDDQIFITSGSTNGALSIFDNSSLEKKQISIPEGPKAIDYTDDYLVVMEGTGSKLHLYDRGSFNFYKTYDLNIPNNIESKAEIDILNNRVYFSAAENGMQVFDLEKEELVDEIAIQDQGNCNAVSVNDNLAFLANGLNGVYVVKIRNSGLYVLGAMKFDASTNFVAVNDNVLFVAAGESGFKIIEIVEDNSYSSSFDDGNSSEWIECNDYSGCGGDYWQIVDEKFVCDRNTVYGSKGSEDRAFLDDRTWTDYTIEADANLIDGDGSIAYGIYFRVKDWPHVTGYVFQYDEGWGKTFKFRKFINGIEQYPILGETKAPKNYTWRGVEKHLKIEVSGNTFKAYISDIDEGKIPVLTATDKSISEGSVGLALKTWYKAKVSFDNIVVTPN